MRSWKHWTLTAIIAFFVIIIGFTACSYGTGELEVFSIHGTWNYNENMTVFITENSVIISKANGSFELNIIDSSMVNNNLHNINDFPSGIRLNGKILSSTGSYAAIYSVGNDVSILFFFNSAKNRMITNIDYNFIFIKEEGGQQILCRVYNCPICPPVKETEHQGIMCLVYNCPTCPLVK